MDLTRRQLLGSSVGLAAAALPFQDPQPDPRRLKIAFVGAHPDDVETAAAGTVARYGALGHEVVILYLTRGEVGMKGKSKDEAGSIREAEARKACEILRAKPRFLGQIDGSTEVNPGRYDEFRRALEEEKPDVVFTWWPINSHRDHRAVFTMVHDAWLKSKKKGFALFYFENADTQIFHPTHYVDVTEFVARKKEALFSHTWYRDRTDLNLYSHVEICLQSRGLQAGCKYAEAFVAHPMNPPDKDWGLSRGSAAR